MKYTYSDIFGTRITMGIWVCKRAGKMDVGLVLLIILIIGFGGLFLIAGLKLIGPK